MIQLNLGSSAPRKPGLVEEADERVPIATVFGMIGARVPEDLGAGRSRKVFCPFGEIYHSDHGLSAAMRIYLDSNTAYCFSCARHYSPVRLAARAWDVHPRTAAHRLLDHAGITPAAGRRTWEQVCTPVEQAPPDRTQLAAALMTWCRRTVPDFAVRQFDPDITSLLTRCLALLDQVHTQQDALTWLNGCKNAVTVAVDPIAAVSSTV